MEEALFDSLAQFFGPSPLLALGLLLAILHGSSHRMCLCELLRDRLTKGHFYGLCTMIVNRLTWGCILLVLLIMGWMVLRY